MIYNILTIALFLFLGVIYIGLAITSPYPVSTFNWLMIGLSVYVIQWAIRGEYGLYNQFKHLEYVLARAKVDRESNRRLMRVIVIILDMNIENASIILEKVKEEIQG